MSRPSVKCIITLVALLGIPDHFLIHWSTQVSSFLSWVMGKVWKVRRKRFEGMRYCFRIHNLYSDPTREASMFSRACFRVSLMSCRVSSDFPLKKSTRPRNFCSWSLMHGSLLSPMWNSISLGFPLTHENYLHLIGLSLMPMLVIFFWIVLIMF